MSQRSLLSEGPISDTLKADGRTDLRFTFPTILADPPWDVLQRGGCGAHRHYSLMTIQEIAALPVGRLASMNAHLWLWVTNATLFEGQAVMEAWGFTYRSCLTWVKPGLGLGSYYLRNNTEHVLFGTRGKAPILYRSQPGLTEFVGTRRRLRVHLPWLKRWDIAERRGLRRHTSS